MKNPEKTTESRINGHTTSAVADKVTYAAPEEIDTAAKTV